MLKLNTELEGKKGCFGHMQSEFGRLGFSLGGNWDYHTGYFDSILDRTEGETIYIRVPFNVLQGELDNYDASIQFKTPYVIKHVVNLGLEREGSSLVSGSFNQFQDPLDKDASIQNKNKWEDAGEQVVKQLLACI